MSKYNNDSPYACSPEETSTHAFPPKASLKDNTDTTIPQPVLPNLMEHYNFMFLRLYEGLHPCLVSIAQIGSRKGGKTHATLDFLTNVFLTIPNSIIYIVRDIDKKLNHTTKDVEKLLIKKGFELNKSNYNKRQKIIRNLGLTNSSIWHNKILFHTLNPERIKDERGGEAGGTTFDGTDNMFVYFEECTQVKKEHVDMFLDTVRGYKTLIKIFSANPWSPFNWYVQWFNEHLPPNIHEMETKGFQVLQKPMWSDYVGDTEAYLGEALFIRSSVAINPYVSIEEKANLLAYKDINKTMYEISYLGIDGIQEGALYSEALNKLKDIDYEMIYENSSYNQFNIHVGIDWGIGQENAAGATTCYLGFVSASLGINVCKEYTRWNNYKRRKTQKVLSEAEMILEILNKIKEWRAEIIAKRPYANNKIIAYVDNGSMGAFHDKWNAMLVNVGLTMYDIEFKPAIKYDIEERVLVCNLMIGFGTLRIDKKECPDLIKAMHSTYRLIPRTGLKEDSRFERTPDTTHWINGGIEYIQGDLFNSFRLPFQSHYEGAFKELERTH